MLLGYPIGEIALLALWIAGAGILVGIFSGLFGIGGGAVIVPVLYEIFRVLGVPEDVRMQLCIGTSLAIIVPTTVRSYRGHQKRGAGIQHGGLRLRLVRRRPHAVGQRSLEPRHAAPGTRPAVALRLRHRPVLV